MADPERPRTLDVLLGGNGEHLAPHDADEGRNEADPDGDHGVGEARTERGSQGQRQNQEGEGLHGIDHAHDDPLVPEAAEVAGEEAQQHPDAEGDEHRDDGGGHGDARTEDDARENIPAQIISTHDVTAPGRLDDVIQVLVVGTVRGDEGGEQGHEDHHADDHGAHDRRLVAAEPDPEERPRRQVGDGQSEIIARLIDRDDGGIGCGHRQLPYETVMRGSSTAYVISTSRLTRMTSSAETSTAPWMVMKSRSKSACTMRRPKPGMEKMVSVSTRPPRRLATARPEEVTTGMRALRVAWRKMTTQRPSPFARAVRT